jgi:hypothetical protein
MCTVHCWINITYTKSPPLYLTQPKSFLYKKIRTSLDQSSFIDTFYSLQICWSSTLIKNQTKFSSYLRKFRWERLQSHIEELRKGFLIYEEMQKHLTVYEEAVSHIWLCNRSVLNFLIYEENWFSFFISVQYVEHSFTKVRVKKDKIPYAMASE